jgi:hypothetical protein
MKPISRLAAAGVVAALVCGVIPLGQAAAQMAKLQGTYLLDDPAAMPKIKKAVDKVADQMGFFAASIARDRLMEANKPAQKLVITVSGNEATTQFDNDQAIRTTADGSTVDWTRDNGEKVRVTTSWQGETLKRAVSSRDATRVSSFSLDATGNVLTLDVEITSEHLPQPLIYKLIYQRNG